MPSRGSQPSPFRDLPKTQNEKITIFSPNPKTYPTKPPYPTWSKALALQVRTPKVLLMSLVERSGGVHHLMFAPNEDSFTQISRNPCSGGKPDVDSTKITWMCIAFEPVFLKPLPGSGTSLTSLRYL